MNRRLPTWDELCYFGEKEKLSNEERGEVENLRGRPPFFLGFARFLLSLLSKDPSIRKFVNLSWAEIVDVVHEQAAQHLFLDLPQKGMEPIRDFSNRTHAQQPCTKHTTQSRVELAKEICQKDQPILLLGDDDLVGISLARAGFSDVTCIDIDEDLCNDIQQIAKQEGLSLKVLQLDISQDPPEQYRRPYALVFADPIYSPFGLKLFLGAAKRFISDKENAKIFLSIHLMSLFKEGLEKAEVILEDLNLDLVKRYPAFNTYPAPQAPAKAIMMFNSVVIRTKLMRKGNHIQFFASDGFLLQPK